MVETITAAASPALDHIIERPRLIARLEEGGGARVSVLAAPAGYGKTTLARQWSQRQDGPVAWYRTTRASGDVALLAVQIDDLLASIAPELPREPEKVATIASVNPSPQPLGRAILRTFETLSRDVLLVVDEWEAAGTEEAEELLSMLVEGLDIRFLITTRTRPDWFTPRLEVYGEGLEIGVDELTMTDEEAALVLNAVGAVAGRARLMRTADGWPAVLGLAAMSGDVDFTSSRLLSHTLYEFLASELLASATEETQAALMLLAVANVTEVDVARTVLGTDTDDVIEDAMARGLISVTEHRSLSLHPLLRELLIRPLRRGRCGSSCRSTRAYPQAVQRAPMGRGALRCRGVEGRGLRHRGDRSSTGRPPGRRPHKQPAAVGRGGAGRGSRRRTHRLRRERGTSARRRTRPSHGPRHASHGLARRRSCCARPPRRRQVSPSGGPLGVG